MPIRGILNNDYPDFEVLVVDQSDNDLTELALKAYLGDSRLRYIRSGTKGISAGRNVGISHAQGAWIAMTDDDCDVPKNWLREFVAAFSVNANIALVFGDVLPVAHDRAEGFVVSCVGHQPVLARTVREQYLVEGTSACMAISRTAAERLGGYDPILGVGARLKSGEDLDLCVRALLAGYFVYRQPSVKVIHHCLVPWAQAGRVNHQYLYGNGAMFAKHVKCGNWSAVTLLRQLLWKGILGSSSVRRGNQRQIWLKTAAFICGFTAGAFTAVDRANYRFAPSRRDSATPNNPQP